MKAFIQRNSKLSCSATKVFTNADDYTDVISFQVHGGYRPMAADNYLIGDYEVKISNKTKAGTERIKITFELDQDGILNVTAFDRLNDTDLEIVNRLELVGSGIQSK